MLGVFWFRSTTSHRKIKSGKREKIHPGATVLTRKKDHFHLCSWEQLQSPLVGGTSLQ